MGERTATFSGISAFSPLRNSSEHRFVFSRLVVESRTMYASVRFAETRRLALLSEDSRVNAVGVKPVSERARETHVTRRDSRVHGNV